MASCSLSHKITSHFSLKFKILEKMKVTKDIDHDTLISVSRTSLRTKVHPDLADLLTEVDVFQKLVFVA